MPTHDQPIPVPATPECPSPERLKEYLLGMSDEASSGCIDRHLESCSACNQSIQSLESKLGPTWGLSGLRTANAASGMDVEGEPVSGPIPNSEDRILQDAFEASRLAVAPRDIPGIVGPYRLLKSIGRGGMGEVYQAEHTKLKKIVAIKLLPLYVSNAHAIERFEREIQAAGKLNHSAIVNSTDAGIDSGYQYLAMEFIEGLDLGRLCRCVGPISCADACEIGRQMALGLAHAHAMGMVHRDIKPSNVMLDPSGNIKLLDFGLVLLSQWDSPVGELTTVGQFLGTLDYMAPEQAERSGSVDHRSDLYSLGATLFRLLTGQLPIAMLPSQSPLEKLRALTNHSPIRIQTLRKDIPSELASIIDQLLSTDPRHRPLSAAHVAQALEPFCKDANLVQLAAQAAKAAPLNLAPEVAPNPHPLGRQGRGGRKGFGWWTVAAAACVPLLAYLGIRIILEDSSGNLVIQSDVDQVHVRLLNADGTPGKEWRVQQGNSITKLMAGNYEITIDSPSNDVTIDQSTLVVKNGETIVARIARQPNNTTPTIPADLTDMDNASGEKEGTAIAWLPKELRDRPILDAMYNGKKIIDYMTSIQLERNYETWLKSLAIIEDAASQEDKKLMSSFVLKAAQEKKFADGIRILRLSDWMTDAEMDMRIVNWFSMSIDPHKVVEAFVLSSIQSCNLKWESHRRIDLTKLEKTWEYIENWLSKSNREGQLIKLQQMSKILAAEPLSQYLFERHPRTAFAICQYYESSPGMGGMGGMGGITTNALVGSERDRAYRVHSRVLISQEDFAQNNVEGVLRQLKDVDQQPASIESETEYWKVVSEQIGSYLNSWAAQDRPVLRDEIRLQLSGLPPYGSLQIPHHTVRTQTRSSLTESTEKTSLSFELLAAYVWIPEKFRPRSALEEVRKMLSKHLGDTSARVDELFPMELNHLEWNDQYRLEKVDEKNKIESFAAADQKAVEAFVLHHSVNALLESDDQSESAIVQRFLEDLEAAGSDGNKPSASRWIVKRGRDTWSEKSLPVNFRNLEFSTQDLKTWINRATVTAGPSQQVIPGMGGGVPIGFQKYSLKFELEWETEGWRIRKLVAVDGSLKDVIMDF